MAEAGEQPRQLTLTQALELAADLLDKNRMGEAEPILSAVLDADPHSPDALHLMGVLRGQQDRGEEAIDWIRKAIAVAPTYAEAHYNLGNILRSMGRASEAIEAFGRAIETAPQLPEAHVALADLLRRAGRREEAVPLYLRAIALNPTLGDAHFRLGKVYYRLGKNEESAAVFRNWLAIDPANPIARHLVAAAGGTAPPDRASDGYVRYEFDSFADTFDEVMQAISYCAPKQIAAALAARAHPSGQFDVLDAGCGTGLVGAAVRPWARRMTGLDLSPLMIDSARRRGVYDELVLAELTAFLQNGSRRFDLVVAADTFIYFGSLCAVFNGIGRSLKQGGSFIFSVEHHDRQTSNGDFILHPHGRYSHTQDYVGRCVEEAGMRFVDVKHATIRRELKDPVAGLIVTAVRP